MRLRQWLWRGKLLLWQLSMARPSPRRQWGLLEWVSIMCPIWYSALRFSVCYSGWFNPAETSNKLVDESFFLPGSCSIEQGESIHANDLRLGVYMLNWSTSSASPWEYLFLNMSILMALRQPSFHIWSLQIFSKPCCQWSFPGCFLVVAQHQMLKLEECLNRFGLATRRSTPNMLFFNTQSDWAKPFLWLCMGMVAVPRKSNHLKYFLCSPSWVWTLLLTGWACAAVRPQLLMVVATGVTQLHNISTASIRRIWHTFWCLHFHPRPT